MAPKTVVKSTPKTAASSSLNFNDRTGTAIAMIRKLTDAQNVTTFVKGDQRITVKKMADAKKAGLSKK